MNKTESKLFSVFWKRLIFEQNKNLLKYRSYGKSVESLKQPIFGALIAASFFISACCTTAVAQQQQPPNIINVKGFVLDSEDNQPVVGTVIIDEAKKVLGVSDVNGFYDIKLAKGSEATFRSVGYKVLTRTFEQSSGKIDIKLSRSATELTEVVVTALNIERSEKALGYAVTTIDNAQLTDAVSNNWTDALSGKVAGLNLIRSNSGPTGSSSIILRGESNLTGSNDALIVVDGVIINGGSGRRTGGGGAYLDDETVVDYGTSLEDINPDDIENVTVLKGPGAAALYGSRGANGAIIITTKTGKSKEKGLGIRFNSNTSFATINRMPSISNLTKCTLLLAFWELRTSVKY